MRGKKKFGLILLLAVFTVPAFGQGQPPDKTIAVFGQTIHYFDIGSGPVVVLLHGLGSRKDDWLPVLEPMAQKYRLLVPDQIGFGKSDKPLLDYSIQTYVDFLNEFLRQLKVEKANLVGESLGGWIAGLYVAEIGSGAHLIPVEKLVLVDAAGLKQDKPIPDLNPSSLAAMRGLMEAIFYDTSWLNEEALRRTFTEKLASIKVPTLVTWGKQDKLLPIGAGERYAAGIAGAKLVSFEKCGHVPPIEKTEEFLAAVTAFLGGGAAAH